jgi:transcription elongation factor GreB
MSKAFTKEDTETDDDLPDTDDDLPDEEPIALPAGAKNYITPAGFRRMQEERKHLQTSERPRIVDIVSWAAGNGDRSENGDYIYGKQRLREIDRRLRFLTKRLESAEIVDPARQAHLNRIFFGATVTYANAAGDERTITIVGVDEVDADNGKVSWISPIARALLKAQEGDVVELRTPHGPEPIEVVEIRYGG